MVSSLEKGDCIMNCLREINPCRCSDSVLDLYSKRIENEAKSFFDSKLDFFDALQFDYESGSYSNADDYEVFEKFFFSRFREDEDINAFYSIFDNTNTFKLHRETPGYLSTQIRKYVNYTFQYRWDRSRPISTATNMSNFIESEILIKDYVPFEKSWYLEGTARYPSGYWEGPSFSSSSCSSAGCDAPIYIYVRKVIWSNSSRHSVHKVKFRTSSVSNLLDSLYEKEENRDSIDFVLINGNYDVVSYRTMKEQVKDDGKTFRKIWELDSDHFQSIKEQELQTAMKSNNEKERELSGGLKVFPLGGDYENWAIVFHVSKAKYFEGLYVRSIISTVMSFVILFLFLVVVCVTTCTMCEMRLSETRKRKSIRTTCMISECVSKLDFENKKVKKLMKKKKRKCTKLERYLKEIITNIQSYMQYLPESLRTMSDEKDGGGNFEEGESMFGDSTSNDSSRDEIISVGSAGSSINDFGVNNNSTGSENSFNMVSTIEKKNKKIRKYPKINKRIVRLELGLRRYPEVSFLLLSLCDYGDYFQYLSPKNISNFFEKYFSLISAIESNRGMVHSIVSTEVIASWNLGRRVVKHKELAVKTAIQLLNDFDMVIGGRKQVEKILGLRSNSNSSSSSTASLENFFGKNKNIEGVDKDSNTQVVVEGEEGRVSGISYHNLHHQQQQQQQKQQKIKLPRLSLAVVTETSVFYGNMKYGNGNGRAVAVCGDTIKKIGVLELLNQKYGTDVILNEKISESVSMFLPLQIIDIISKEDEKITNNNLFLYTIGKARNKRKLEKIKKQEWMYELQDKSNPYDKFNDSWKILRGGNWKKAKEALGDYLNFSTVKLEEMDGDDPHVKRLANYISRMEDKEEEEEEEDLVGMNVVSESGDFEDHYEQEKDFEFGGED